MILRLKSVYSQRDPRWASEKLGTSNSSIGMYGCLITTGGMYVDKTPTEINKLLTDNKGYQDGDLVIWSKFAQVLGITDTYLSPKWSDVSVTPQGLTKIKEFLDGGYPLICHIDFNPADTDDDMHWLLLIGYEGDKFFAADPWTGQIIDLDVYGGAKRAIIQYRAYDKKLSKSTPDDTITIEKSLFEKLVTEGAAYQELKKDYAKQTENYQKVISGLNQEITDLTHANQFLGAELAECKQKPVEVITQPSEPCPEYIELRLFGILTGLYTKKTV